MGQSQPCNAAVGPRRQSRIPHSGRAHAAALCRPLRPRQCRRDDVAARGAHLRQDQEWTGATPYGLTGTVRRMARCIFWARKAFIESRVVLNVCSKWLKKNANNTMHKSEALKSDNRTNEH